MKLYKYFFFFATSIHLFYSCAPTISRKAEKAIDKAYKSSLKNDKDYFVVMEKNHDTLRGSGLKFKPFNVFYNGVKIPSKEIFASKDKKGLNVFLHGKDDNICYIPEIPSDLAKGKEYTLNRICKGKIELFNCHVSTGTTYVKDFMGINKTAYTSSMYFIIRKNFGLYIQVFYHEDLMKFVSDNEKATILLNNLNVKNKKKLLTPDVIVKVVEAYNE